MVDPLAEIVTLLQPQAPFSKIARASGAWRVRRTEVGQVYYGLMTFGSARLEVDGKPAFILRQGDFVLIPAIKDFTMSSLDPPPPAGLISTPVMQADRSVRIGSPDARVEVEQLIGYCRFGSPDASLLVSLLPDIVVVRGESRLGILAKLVAEEAHASRPARDVVLARLLEVLLIEAFRSSGERPAGPGVLRGMGDDRLVMALRCMHADPARAWTIAELAREAGLSRSTFFTRFQREVGRPPMDYLTDWRITLAKDLLRRGRSLAEVARRIGYGSTSAFSVAFSRHVGLPPAQYAGQLPDAGQLRGPAD